MSLPPAFRVVARCTGGSSIRAGTTTTSATRGAGVLIGDRSPGSGQGIDLIARPVEGGFDTPPTRTFSGPCPGRSGSQTRWAPERGSWLIGGARR